MGQGGPKHKPGQKIYDDLKKMLQRMTKQQNLRHQIMSTNRDTLIITNTLKGILVVPVIAVLLIAVVPHTQGAIPAIMKFKLNPDHPTPPQPTDNNPLGLMVPGLSGHCDGSNTANLMNLS